MIDINTGRLRQIVTEEIGNDAKHVGHIDFDLSALLTL